MLHLMMLLLRQAIKKDAGWHSLRWVKHMIQSRDVELALAATTAVELFAAVDSTLGSCSGKLRCSGVAVRRTQVRKREKCLEIIVQVSDWVPIPLPSLSTCRCVTSIALPPSSSSIPLLHQVRARLADFASQAAALTRPGTAPAAATSSGAAQASDGVGDGDDSLSLNDSPPLPSSSVTEVQLPDQTELGISHTDSDDNGDGDGEGDIGGDSEARNAAAVAAEENEEGEEGAVEVAPVNDDDSETDVDMSDGDVVAGAGDNAAVDVVGETLPGLPAGLEVADDASDASSPTDHADDLSAGAMPVVGESTVADDLTVPQGAEEGDK